MTAGRTPVACSMAVLAFESSASRAARPSGFRRACVYVWLPTSWPAALIFFAVPGNASTEEPIMKKDARTS